MIKAHYQTQGDAVFSLLSVRLASAGLVKYNEANEGQSLVAVLVPPAIFIAVMALQLRYFTSQVEEAGEESFQSSVGFNRAVSQIFKTFVPTKEGEGEIESSLGVTSEAGAKRRSTSQEIEEVDVELVDGIAPTKKLTAYVVVMYVLIKLRMAVVFLWHLMWQFGYVHTHKLVIICMLALALYEVSMAYFVLVVLLLLTSPTPLLNFISYPIITVYLGTLSMAKFFYQLEVVQAGTEAFSFTTNCSTCVSTVEMHTSFVY